MRSGHTIIRFRVAKGDLVKSKKIGFWGALYISISALTEALCRFCRINTFLVPACYNCFLRVWSVFFFDTALYLFPSLYNSTRRCLKNVCVIDYKAPVFISKLFHHV